MGWSEMIELAGVAAPVAVAVVVALMVSGRDDQRQRDAERRQVQRETIIALQDGWLEFDDLVDNARQSLGKLQARMRAHREDQERLRLLYEAESRGEPRSETGESARDISDRMVARAEEVNRAGDRVAEALVEL